ncbi:MAG: phospho-N-acetylmuramoyl-pentapeptide-transferase [Lachnospiraceae bacterium]|jgi:phospho-N-acetylmuramoyl-pentapeptide-transferase|nr:phospho-N-acetylmuramoyl-pentapeptide-transferase [Lachnospiraceae bacterium]
MNSLYNILFNPVFLFFLVFIVSVILFYGAWIELGILQFRQVVRDDGPETHLKKSGTPTMAGVVFIIIFLIVELFLLILKDYVNGTQALKINIFIIIFGFIGLIDDYLKVSKKNTKGLPGIFKLILQILFAGFGLIICFNYNTMSNIFAFLFLIFIIVGTNNGVNFTDGLDGLCTLVTMVVSLLFCVVSFERGNNELLYINLLILAILLAFIIFNHYPAKIFMGDTGSLFLGAYVAFMAIALDMQYYLPIFGIVYMCEVLSVIIQVLYFKATKGKRFFKMAPIHHHFEKCGFSENQVVLMFALVTIVGCVITYYLVR